MRSALLAVGPTIFARQLIGADVSSRPCYLVQVALGQTKQKILHHLSFLSKNHLKKNERLIWFILKKKKKMVCTGHCCLLSLRPYCRE